MSNKLETVKNLLLQTTDRLHREEEKDEPDLRNILFSLSSLTTAAIGSAVAIEEIYSKLLAVEKAHDKRLLDLSRKIIYLSAMVSIGGGIIVILGKYIVGLILK